MSQTLVASTLLTELNPTPRNVECSGRISPDDEYRMVEHSDWIYTGCITPLQIHQAIWPLDQEWQRIQTVGSSCEVTGTRENACIS